MEEITQGEMAKDASLGPASAVDRAQELLKLCNLKKKKKNEG